jgi:hypothetical protein
VHVIKNKHTHARTHLVGAVNGDALAQHVAVHVLLQIIGLCVRANKW